MSSSHAKDAYFYISNHISEKIANLSINVEQFEKEAC
jgi:hypothetical protein